MKHFAVILTLLFGSGNMHAQSRGHTLEWILFQSYDSIRIEMMRTACEIGGVKDSAFLKEVSEGRVDSAIVHHRVNPYIIQLLQQSNKPISGAGYQEYDTAVRMIRANLMGFLLIQNHRNEEVILQRFDTHKKGLDSLSSEAKDFMIALRDTAFSVFIKDHPNSKFSTLIQGKDEVKKGKTDYWDVVMVLVAALTVMLTMILIAYVLKIRRKSIVGGRKQVCRKNKKQEENTGEHNDVPSPASFTDSPQQSGNAESVQDITRLTNEVKARLDAFGTDEANAFAQSKDNWTVVGASVIGNSHISMGLPCQDNNKYLYIKNGWGIAITSDGAGSAKHSEIGSRIVVERGLEYFRSVVEQKKWAAKNVLPTEAEWTNIAYTAIKAIRADLEKFAVAKHIALNSLSATIIVVIHTPLGFLTTHVGDGRAGYKDDTGEWNALMTPHKGEEANQTIFLTNDLWDIPYYVMSGVMVPESHVVRCHPIAFTLMSDGCEHAAWQCNMKNEATGVFYDPNKPFDCFFNPLLDNLYSDDTSNLKMRWVRFVSQGNKLFVNESDDRTIILGVSKNTE